MRERERVSAKKNCNNSQSFSGYRKNIFFFVCAKEKKKFQTDIFSNNDNKKR